MPLSILPQEPIVLVKATGERFETRAGITSKVIYVQDAKFPVATGDIIERQLPSGIVERYEVVEPGYQGAFGGIKAHYGIKVRNAAAKEAAKSVVNNYHNAGQVGAMGNNASAAIEQMVFSPLATADVAKVIDELVRLRTALVADVSNPDTAIELGNVGAAEKALRAGDQSGFHLAIKRFGTVAWGFCKTLGLEWFNKEARERLGLPPTAA